MSGNSFYYIVRGARMVCDHGTHIRQIDMPAGHGSYIREKPMLHGEDNKVGLDANIPPFGACSSPNNNNIDIVIHDAENIIPGENGEMPSMPVGGKLCAPVFGGKWCDVHEDTLVDGIPALTTNSTLVCTCGGVIFFIDNGQFS